MLYLIQVNSLKLKRTSEGIRREGRYIVWRRMKRSGRYLCLGFLA